MVKISFAILVILNLVLIFLLVARPEGPGMQARNENMGNAISDMLNFNDAQRVKFDNSAKKHSEELMQLNNQQLQAMNDYFTLLKAQQVDEQEKTVALEKLKQIEGEKVKITFDHFEELKSICNEEQLAKFQEVVDQVIPRLLGNGKNMPPPPRDR